MRLLMSTKCVYMHKVVYKYYHLFVHMLVNVAMFDCVYTLLL